MIRTSPEKDPLEICVIVRSEKILSSNSILSIPFEKSVIISETFILVLASEMLQTKISAPALRVSVSFTPAPEPPSRVFAELFPVILSDAEPPLAFSIIGSYAIPINPSLAPNALYKSVSD